MKYDLLIPDNVRVNKIYKYIRFDKYMINIIY